MTNPILKVSNLTLKLRIEGALFPVVEDLSLELKKGQTLALVGESGCGKSMTALAIMRILPQPPAIAPEGKIFYNDIDLLGLKEREMRKIRGRKIAMVFQDPGLALNPVYTIGEQLREVALTHLDCDQQWANDLVIKSINAVHLPSPKEIMALYPHQLSGGMLQRVMIAMALICSPDILIADEPTTALDVTIQKQILTLLKELQDKRGMATLLITHDMGVVAQNANDVIVMYGGHFVEKGSVYSLLKKPLHPYTQGLLASRPDWRAKKKKLATISGSVPRITESYDGCRFHPRCRHAMEKCKMGPVPGFCIGDGKHVTKCWLYETTP